MDNKITNTIKDVIAKGKKVAPVKSIKLKMKFGKVDSAKKKIVKNAIKQAGK